MRSVRRRGDAGVTLIEVLIVVVILGVIIGPLTTAMILYLRNTEATTDRLAESHDAQIAAAYFTQDVQSMGARDWSDSVDADNPYMTFKPSIELGSAPQGLAACPGEDPTTQLVVRFAGDEPVPPTGGTRVRTVSYRTKQVGSSPARWELHRIACTDGVAGTADIVIVHDLTTAPAVACEDSSGTAITNCAPALPATVKLTLTLQAPASKNPYRFTLVGQRRQT
ncbi:MAG TPA: prepilin-type N-terminal cleavage/methylation domain-containing protein [Micromonosporaceae bacterium]|jgi:prepilin-type N-terminal cleavage/methylation domain-containing protein